MLHLNRPLRLIVFASGNGSNFEAIQTAIINKELNAEVLAVMSDKEKAYVHTRAKKFNIPSFYFYGNSKLQAEKGIESLVSPDFKVSIIRPPMIYGKGSKGNYPKLAKLAKLTPIFPDFPNQRSMLHIDNLCEFIKLLIDNQESGVFFPQNEEYVNTSQLVKEIANIHGKKIRLVKLFNPLIRMFFKISIVNKVFGNLVYDSISSQYLKGHYTVNSFKESIIKTER